MTSFKFLFSFCSNRMDQTRPKYSQFRKLEHLQENIFEVHASFWKHCFQLPLSQKNSIINQIRLGLSYLHEHKFKYSFQDSLNPICRCSKDIETSPHFVLHQSNHSNERSTFLIIIGTINKNILTRSNFQVTKTFLYGDSN